MKKTKKLLNNYVQAKIEESWIGSRELQEFPRIKENVRKTRKLLITRLEEMEYVLKKITVARECFNLCGAYPNCPDGPANGELFHDWAANFINAIVKELD